jgi:hypothetical protein
MYSVLAIIFYAVITVKLRRPFLIPLMIDLFISFVSTRSSLGAAIYYYSVTSIIGAPYQVTGKYGRPISIDLKVNQVPDDFYAKNKLYADSKPEQG